ncbi:MAG: outer membrane lipoprotein-sorting protein [Myxococcota bacterium]|jgi:outer membrane lipoprotein-sorting protein
MHLKRNLVGILGLIFASMAHATPQTGPAWLAHIDAVARVDDAHMVLELTVTDARGEQAGRTIEIWQKGDDKRLVRMVEPTRLKGVGLLVTHGDALHLFLPQYPPARRVVGSKRADAFMGTDFAVDDLARIGFADDYDAEIIGTEAELTRLSLTPRTDTGDASVDIWVGDDGVIRRLEHINKRGEVTRRLTMDDVRLEGETPLAHRMEVVDVKRTRSTVAVLQSAALDQGLSDELFTVSALENP